MRVGNNSLEYIPPEIAQLHALKDLDVVNNNLRFLPAEMTTMTFTNLKVHTNPWYPGPANPAARDVPDTVDAATHAHFRVPPLREVILRYLLTPSSTNQQRALAPRPTAMSARTLHQPTTLEDRFQLPLQDGALSPADAALFARVAPAAVSAPRRHGFSRATTTSASACAGMFPSAHVKTERVRGPRAIGAVQEQKCFGRCPSPRHCSAAPALAPETSPAGSGAAMAWARLGPPFVMPAEERYTWVTEVAGVRVGETTGGVPLLWRGCGRGCLEFLDSASATPALDREKN